MSDRRLRASFVVYNAALVAGSPLLAGYLAWRLAKGKSRDGWGERWGRLPEAMRKHTATRVWCHAASVGEVMAAAPVLKEIKARDPDLEIVMTTITPGGHEIAQGMVDKLLAAVGYLPFDLMPLTKRAVRHIAPDLFIGVETEIWPNLLHALHTRDVPSVLINARISDRSYPRYRRIRWLLRGPLSCYDVILAQSQHDADRFISLGAPTENVMVAGNVKFDQAEDPLCDEAIAAMKAEFHIPTGSRVWVVGSTRTAEEERMVLAAYRLAKQTLNDLVLILAPRHVDRAEAVVAGVRDAGFAVVRRTQLAELDGTCEAIVLDTFGELARVYAMADVAFVGNSLVPPGGGQNILQPLAQGKPVLHGPYMSNFRDVVAEASAAGVAWAVSSVQELAATLVTLIRSEDERMNVRGRALALVQTNRGAAARCAHECLARLARRVSVDTSSV